MDTEHFGPAIGARVRRDYDLIALVFQGGGALGAYQGGVYQALHEAGIEPDWVAGISIGAINAALVAGNRREDRLAMLREFWERITQPGPGAATLPQLVAFERWLGEFSRRGLASLAAAGGTLSFGQRGFFFPRVPPPALRPRGSFGATSFYDTGPLAATLEELVDFELLNDGPMRASVGAVQVETGNFVYFDNRLPGPEGEPAHIGPAQIMASGALPPAFPAIRIGSHHYWDGGLVSNTPLEYVLDHDGHTDTIAFQVDLWSARGALPQDLVEVLERQKDIQFSSRTRKGTDNFARLQGLRHRIAELIDRLPEQLRADPAIARLAGEARSNVMNVIHLIYRAQFWESHAKDYEFSRASMEAHWQAGYADTRASLRRDFLARPGRDRPVATHDIHRAGRRVD